MNAVVAQPAIDVGTGRSIVFRTRGRAHGPVVRMISPSDVGQMIKPFVSRSRRYARGDWPTGLRLAPAFRHSHSDFVDGWAMSLRRIHRSRRNDGGRRHRVVERRPWRWHSGFGVPPIKAFQLWIASPAERELAPAFSHHLSVKEIPSDGPARTARTQWRSGQPDQCTSRHQLFRCAAQGRSALDLPARAGLSGRLDRGDGRQRTHARTSRQRRAGRVRPLRCGDRI